MREDLTDQKRKTINTLDGQNILSRADGRFYRKMQNLFQGDGENTFISPISILYAIMRAL